MSTVNEGKIHHRGKMAEEVRRCFDCDRNMRGKRTTYQYTECGLNSVKLFAALFGLLTTQTLPAASAAIFCGSLRSGEEEDAVY